MATLRELITKITFSTDTAPLEKVAQAVDGIKTRLNVLVGAEAVRALAALTDKFGNFALDLRNSAEAAGITTAEFQKLAYAAAQSGVSQEELGKALGGLNKRLQAARLGSEEANLAFSRAGITPEQVGGFKNAEEALFALGQGLSSIKDPILRAAAAQETLGEGGTRLLASMNAGAKGLGTLSRSADAASNVVNDQMIGSLVASEQATMALKASLTTLGAQLMATLAPTITATVKALSAMVASLRSIVGISFGKFVYNVGYAMGFTKGVVEDVSLVIIQTVRLLNRWGEDSGLFKAIANGFAFIGDMAVKAFDALGTAANWVLQKLAELTVWFEHVDLRSLRGIAKAFKDVAVAVGELTLTGIITGLQEVYSLIGRIYALITQGITGDTPLAKIIADVGALGRMVGGALHLDAAANAAAPIDALNNAQVPAMVQPTLKQMPQAQQTPGPQPNITVQAPVTINVAGTADPQKLYKAVQDGVADHHDKVLRQSQSALNQATVY